MKAPDANPDSRAEQRTRVLCVDDSADIAKMLALLVRREPDMESVGTLGSAEGIVDEVIRLGVEVVVLDLTMPGPSPLQSIRELAMRVPSCRVIAFSGHDDLDTTDEVRRAGAWGLVSKAAETADILAAIRLAAGAGTQRARPQTPRSGGGETDAVHQR